MMLKRKTRPAKGRIRKLPPRGSFRRWCHDQIQATEWNALGWFAAEMAAIGAITRGWFALMAAIGKGFAQ